MNLTRTHIAIAAAALILAVLIGSSLWSDRKLSRLEKELDDAKLNADAAGRRSAELELEAAEYKRKIEYLEASLSEVERTAAKQDEEIKLLEKDTNAARRDAGRARGIERVTSTAAELCRKLAGLGHPCDGTERVTDH